MAAFDLPLIDAADAEGDPSRRRRFFQGIANAMNALIRNGQLQKTDLAIWTVNPNNLPASGVTPGAYTLSGSTFSFTVNAQGIITSAATGSAYTLVQTNGTNVTVRSTLNFDTSFTITDVSSKTKIALSTTGVAAATYTNANVTVDIYGRVVTITNGSASGISPLTTKGDIWAYSSADARFPVGTDAQMLVVKASATFGFQWVSASGDITIDNAGVHTIGNTKVTLAKIQNATANSKLIGAGASGSGSSYVEVTLGSNLSFTGTTLNVATGLTSPLTTKGDTWVYSTVDARLPVGSDGTLLVAASGQTTGQQWQTVTTAIRGKVGGAPVIVMKQSDESRQNTASPTADSELLFAIGANEQWVVEWHLFVSGNSTGDIRTDITFPTGCTGSHVSFGLASAATTSGNLQTGGEALGTSPTGDQGTAAPGVGSTIGLLLWSGLINGANAGNITLRWAQIVADNTSATKLLKGSFLIAHRIA